MGKNKLKKIQKGIFSTDSNIKLDKSDKNKTKVELANEINLKYSNIKEKINKLWNKI